MTPVPRSPQPRLLLIALALPALAACFGETTPSDFNAPIVVITAPSGNTVSGLVTFSAGVVDDYGVAVVNFYAGEMHLFEDKAPPYEVQWGTMGFPDGAIQLRVIAADLSGNTGQAAKTVTVNNTPN